MTLSAVQASDEAPAGWDAFVRDDIGASFAHLSGWRQVLGDTFGHRHVFAWIEGDGDVVACMPLVDMPYMLRGRALVSIPYLNEGGPVGSAEGKVALAAWAEALAEERKAKSLEIRCRRPCECGLSGGRPKVTVVLQLPDDADDLWKNGLRAKVRSQVRRPIKEGMTFRHGPDELDGFYGVFARNMRDLGTPVLPRALFSSIRDTFGDLAHYGVVYYDGVPVAGGCGFAWKGEFEMTWASSLREYNRLAPNMLLYWSFIKLTIERGLTRFNFGRCTPGGGTHRFKRQWGGEDEPLAWLQWPGSDAVDVGEAIWEKALRRIWTRLPVPLANLIGPRVTGRVPRF